MNTKNTMNINDKKMNTNKTISKDKINQQILKNVMDNANI
jgi:hypothetical protein